MFRPMLIIGVGGSGGKTLRSMKQAIERRLESVRYEGGIPACWQFLQIDTTYDGQEFPAPMLHPTEEFKSVVPRGAEYEDILRNVTAKASRPKQQTMMAGWGLAECNVSVSEGAGQMRGIGRFVGIADSANTLSVIQNSIQKMMAGIGELRAVAEALGGQKPIELKPQVFIISSLCGGSGSGMFLDVAELVKRSTTEAWASNSISFLYTAEVFKSLNNGGPNLAKNSLGAMNEIIAAKWVALSRSTSELYDGLGMAQPGRQAEFGFGSKGTFLIGATNKGNVNLALAQDGAGMNEVFLTIGEAMATAFTTENIAEWLYQIAFVNVTQTEASFDLSGLSPTDARNKTFAAAGMGFGQLTLGADRIVEYVADSMTKLQVRKLLWPELEKDLLKNGETTVSLIEKKADDIFPEFLVSSGLDEKGDQDQIIDSLFPDTYLENNSKFSANLVKQVIEAEAASRKGEIALRTFQNRLWDLWVDASEVYLKEAKEEISAKAQNWVPAVQAQIRDLCSNELNRNGYLVLANLVNRLQRDLLDQVVGELKGARTKFAKATDNLNAETFRGNINEAANGLTGIVPGGNGEFLKKIAKYLSNILEYKIKAHVNSLAADLVIDLNKNMLEPLNTFLVNSRSELSEQIKAAKVNEQPNPFPSFPDWGMKLVPDRYLPRTIERILIDSSEYESTYQLYAERDAGGTTSFNQSVSAGLLGKKLNPLPGQKNEQTLILQESPWVSGVRETLPMGGAESKIMWSFKTNMEDLGIRNRKWLKDIDSSFGRFTTMSIREFVAADGLDPLLRKAREDKFIFEFDEMLSLSQPLALLNNNSIKYVLSAKLNRPADGLISRSDKIPFARDSRIGNECVRVLSKYIPAEEVNDPGFDGVYFKADSNATRISAVTTNQASLPAWAFASLTEPILVSAASSKLNAPGWKQFWDTRRTRPLTECIPFEAEMRRSIITGWILGGLFGLTEVSPNKVGKDAKVWNSTLQNPGWSNFPSPLLRLHKEDAQREIWVLPSILMSAGLAMCEFGKTGDPKEIQAYLFLKYLGREVTTEIDSRDTWDNPGDGDRLPTSFVGKSTLIRDWVTTGKHPAPDRSILQNLQEQLKITPDRAVALLMVVAEIRDQYANVWKEMTEYTWDRLPDTWELRDDIDLALADIHNFVSKLHEPTISKTLV